MKLKNFLLFALLLGTVSDITFARPRGGVRPRSYSTYRRPSSYRRPYYRSYSRPYYRKPYRSHYRRPYWQSYYWWGQPYSWWWNVGPYWWWYDTKPYRYYRNISDDYVEDNAGKTYWRVSNMTPIPVSISTDREKGIMLAPGEQKKIYRYYDLGMIIKTDHATKVLQSKDHIVTLTPQKFNELQNLDTVRETFKREQQEDQMLGEE